MNPEPAAANPPLTCLIIVGRHCCISPECSRTVDATRNDTTELPGGAGKGTMNRNAN